MRNQNNVFASVLNQYGVHKVSATCPIHGCHKITLDAKSHQAPFCPKCVHERDVKRGHETAQNLMTKQARMFMKEHSIIEDESLMHKTFQNYNQKVSEEATRNYKHAELMAENYTNSLNDHVNLHDNLFLVGPSGRGKSHLAAAILNYANKHLTGRQKCLFIDVNMMFEQIKDGFIAHDSVQGEIVNAIADSDLVVLDDLGAENAKDGDWMYKTLFQIANCDRPQFIITTNESAVNMHDKYGSRLMSRLERNARLIRFTKDGTPKDYRHQYKLSDDKDQWNSFKMFKPQ